MIKNNIISLDIETTGLHRKKDHITYIGAYDPEYNKYLILKDPVKADFKKLRRFIGSKQLLWHNGTFDTSFIKAQFNLTLPIHQDSMLVAHILDSKGKKGLKHLATTLLDVDEWDVSLEDKTGSGKVVEEYLKKDVLYTYKIFMKLYKDMSTTDKKLYKKLMIPAANAIRDVQANGIFIDIPQLKIIKYEIELELQGLRDELDNIIDDEKYKYINFNSSVQMADLFYKHFNFPVIARTLKGSPSTNKEAIHQISKIVNHPFLKTFLEFKKSELEHRFCEQWLKFEYEGRLYPSFNLTGTKTGRTSSSDPNLQQVPRSKRLRMLFTAPEGKRFVECDFSQVELRIAGQISQDPEILKAYQQGLDLHTNTAQLFNDEPTSDDRTKAKSMNFGLLYGMQAKSYREYADSNYGVELTIAEATTIRNNFLKLYKNLPRYWKSIELEAQRKGYLENAFGRKLPLNEVWSSNKWSRLKALRQGINFPVQSLASDILVACISEINETLPEVNIVGTVHDSILVEVTKKEHLKQLKDIMENPKILKEFKLKLNLPLVADVEVGAWGSK